LASPLQGRRERGKIFAVITKINSRNQITLPQTVREKLNVKAGDLLLMDVQDSIVILIPLPESNTNRLQGLHSEIWKSVDSENYLHGERDAWDNSAND
jgi:AbrB family looped-hinge helix DNA binding protein